MGTSMRFYATKPLTKTEKTYTNGSNPVTVTETYSYNGAHQLSGTSRTTSSGGTFASEYTYPVYGADAVQTAMTNANMVSPVLTDITKRDGSEIQRLTTTYSNSPGVTTGLVKPVTVQKSVNGGAAFTMIAYDQYDDHGNILQYTPQNGAPVSILWGYNYSFPVAEIKNADYSSVSAALITAGITPASLAAAYSPDMGKVNSLRSGLPDAFVTSYTYQPLAGIASVTDPKARSLTYEYDSYLRLKNIKDQDGNITKHFDYHFRP
jgi:YD repeat-containing protein